MRQMKTVHARKKDDMKIVVPTPKQRLLYLPGKVERNRKAYNRKNAKRVEW